MSGIQHRNGVHDPDQPIYLLMIVVVHFIGSDTETQATIEHYRSRLPMGADCAASYASEDGIADTLAKHMADGLHLHRQSSAPLHTRVRDEFGRFFQGMDTSGRTGNHAGHRLTDRR